MEKASFHPPTKVEHFGSHQHEARGYQMLAEGRAACLLLAGGLGTRLGFEGPKGCVPISPVTGKTLFQLLFEQIDSLQKKVGAAFPVIILVSKINHEQTRFFLEKHLFFGLDPQLVYFLEQGNLPYRDETGRTLENIPDAPNGNGGAYEALCRSPLLEMLLTQGIEWLHCLAIDNPLANPLDPYLLGYMDELRAQAGIKTILRKDPEEAVGIVVEQAGKIGVRDYMEISDEDRHALQDGKLKYALANAGHYCFHLPFLKTTFAQNISLPIHWVKKEKSLYKGEQFLMDLLPYAQTTAVVVYDRATTFAPLKNKTGKDSITTVQTALLHRDKLLSESIADGPTK